jgi:hypothetical protein
MLILLLTSSLFWAACVTTDVRNSFTQILNGEYEQKISETKWQYIQNHRVSYVVLEKGGKAQWYDVTNTYDFLMSQDSTWERNGANITIHANYGSIRFRGMLNENTIAGNMESKNTRMDFIMAKQE